MGYIDAEKLIAEIERQQRRLALLSNTEQVDMRRDCALQNGVYDSILNIISSIRQEQSSLPSNVDEAVYSREQMLAMYKAGAEWQKQQDNNFERYKDYVDKALISLEEAREQGRQEMKEQMLKEAVETEVFDFSPSLPQPYAHISLTPNKYHIGDKVRIIIVKEEWK